MKSVLEGTTTPEEFITMLSVVVPNYFHHHINRALQSSNDLVELIDLGELCELCHVTHILKSNETCNELLHSVELAVRCNKKRIEALYEEI